jgi:hypothetical protein
MWTRRRALASVVSLAVLAVTAFFLTRRLLPRITIAGTTRVEACLVCHAATEGVGAAHAALGCSPCHLGNADARERDTAHAGLELLSGDFATLDRTCGQGACHAVEAARVRASTMARVPGILAVDRFAFGEAASPDGSEADALGSLDPSLPARSPAESHARQLCASCHLGQRKPRAGDLGEAARGGGCTACHLAPPDPRRAVRGGPLHPEISTRVPERRCTGCHSRSGRIALSYHGVVELEPGDPRVSGKLEDGRPTAKIADDVHARAGMGCIDCHTERGLMGDGRLHRHAPEAVDIACDDCHLARSTEPERDADRESVAQRIGTYWSRRGLAPLPAGPPLRTRLGTPLVRTDAKERTQLLAESGKALRIPLAEPRPYHALAGHERLACSACHAQWAPRCGSCHTRFDGAAQAVDGLSGKTVTGDWIERAGKNGFGPPLLALGPRGRIEPFVEGMKLTIAGTRRGTVTRTLFAPLEPHSTGRARACASCHAPDGPDAAYPASGETTRVGARLLADDERAKILRVGRCLPCHEKYEDAVYRDFAGSIERLRHAVDTKNDPVRRCRGRLD